MTAKTYFIFAAIFAIFISTDVLMITHLPKEYPELKAILLMTSVVTTGFLVHAVKRGFKLLRGG